MDITMRELNANDLWTVIKITEVIDIKDDLKRLVNGDVDISGSAEEIGVGVMVDILMRAVKKSDDVKKLYHSLLADVTGMTADEIGKLSLVDYVELNKAFSEKEDLRDFFGALSSLIK